MTVLAYIGTITCTRETQGSVRRHNIHPGAPQLADTENLPQTFYASEDEICDTPSAAEARKRVAALFILRFENRGGGGYISDFHEKGFDRKLIQR